MRKGTVTVGVLCAVILAGPAGAADYDDANTGNWTELDNTWTPTGDYPRTTGDTATVDEYQVTVNSNITEANSILPDLITVAGSGTLYAAGKRIDAPLKLTGGQVTSRDSDWYGSISVGGSATIHEAHAGWQSDTLIYGALADDGANTGVITNTASDMNAIHLMASSSGFTGGWDVQGYLRARADQALGSGTVTINGGQLAVEATQTAGTGPALVRINSGFLNAQKGLDWLVEINGGSYRAGPATLTGTIHVTAAGGALWGYGLDRRPDFAAPITGTGDLTLTKDSSAKGLTLSGDNSGYSGDITVKTSVLLQNANALGTGTTTVVAGGDLLMYQTDLAGDVVVNGGAFGGYYNGSATVEHSGRLILPVDGALKASGGLDRTVTVLQSGTVTGAGKLTAKSDTSQAKLTIELSNPGNDYAGGTSLAEFTHYSSKAHLYRDHAHWWRKMKVSAAGALGSGTVWVDRYRVETAADGSLDSPAAVIVEGGMLYVNSNETATVNVKAAGALAIGPSGAALTGTSFDSQYLIETGAILDYASVLSSVTPTRAQIAGGGQIYYGTTSFAGEESFGEDGSSLYAGLGTVDNDLSITGTMNENAGADGYSIYAQYPKIVTLNGAKLNVNDTAHAVSFKGKGSFRITSLAGNAEIIDLDGDPGQSGVSLMSADSLPSGVTLNVNSGYLYLNNGGGIASGAVVNLNDGGGMYLDKDASTGTVNVKDGGAVWANSVSRFGTAEFNWEEGSQLVLAARDWASVPAGSAGKATYLFGDRWGNTITGGLVLGANSRLMIAPGGYTAAYLKSASGPITTATGVNEAMVTAAPGYATRLDNKLALAGKKLIAGDTGTFQAYSYGGTELVEVTQDGTVWLNSGANEIGEIEVRAGTLRVDATDRLGGAACVAVAPGATLRLDYNSPTVAALFTGDGTILVGDGGSGSSRLTVGAGGGMAPGASVGELTVTGHLSFAATSTVAVQFDTTSGLTNDHILVSGNANIDNANFELDLPAPSTHFAPGSINTALLTGGSLNGTGTLSLAAGMAPALAAHWDISTALQTDATTASLVLTGTSWTARKGNANLDNIVDVLDLARLANNFGKDVANGDEVTWLEADFNLDGKVDVLDLAAIANNFGQSGSVGATGEAGGAPVPEPSALAVVALGGLALIRRRRR